MAARRGDYDAQTRLGRLHEEGLGCSQDYQRAFFWYKKAAKRKRRDSVEAKFNLGRLYQQGLGCHRDLELAESWLREAVEDNYRPALYEYVALATEGVVQAQTNLGYFYWIGKTVSQNHQGSIYWTRLAAEQEDIAAISCPPKINSDFFMLRGLGVARSTGSRFLTTKAW